MHFIVLAGLWYSFVFEELLCEAALVRNTFHLLLNSSLWRLNHLHYFLVRHKQLRLLAQSKFYRLSQIVTTTLLLQKWFFLHTSPLFRF